MSNTPIRGCWIQHGGEISWASVVIKELQKLHVDVIFGATMKDAFWKCEKKGIDALFLGEIITDTTTISEEELIELDAKYGPPGLTSICHSDIHLQLLYGKDIPTKKQIIGRAYKFWEKIIEEKQIDFFLMRDTGSFATRTAYNVAKAKGMPHAVLFMGPSDEYMTLCDIREDFIWQEIEDASKEAITKLTDAQLQEVDSFIAEKTKDREGPASVLSIVPWYTALLTGLKNIRRQKLKNKLSDPINQARFKLDNLMLQHRIAWKYHTLPLFPYDKYQKDEKYVYFPLFFQNEWQNLAETHFVSGHMLSLVEEIADSLPQGYSLYIKEHPAVPGEVSYKNLRKLQRIPNVKIAHPTQQGQQLIKYAEAIVVVCGTTGWESYLHQKPIVTLGRTWYGYSKLVYKVENLSDLSRVLWKAIRTGSDVYTQNIDEWKWYIHQAISSSMPGNIYNVRPPFFTKHGEENAQLIAEGINSKIRRKLQQ